MSKQEPSRARNFDHRLWNRFWNIAKLYWFLEEKWTARGLLALLMLLLLGRTEFVVLFNQLSGEFTSALAAKDAPRFWHAIRLFGVVLVVAVPIYASYYYARDRIGISWRRWLTHRFLDKYFEDRAFYALTYNQNIDNPDQRISDDINSFTQKSLLFLLEIVSAGLQLIAFSGILWAISRPLVAFLVIYAIIGTPLAVVVFGKPLIGLNFQQLKREADFRFGLVRIRENAEAIAFYQGEAREASHVKRRFAEVFNNSKNLIKCTLGLNLFQYGFSFLTLIVPSIIIAPRVLSGELEVGRVVQAAGAFAAMLSSLTVFVENFEPLSAFAAGIERLHTFARFLAVHSSRSSALGGTIAREEHPRLELDNVTVLTPNYQRTLIANVSLAVDRSEGLLIVGASGGGKSSLLRAIAGLWNAGSGTIRRPRLEHMMFLPQRPYMILGTLRSQLLYPVIGREISDDELGQVLVRVNLPDIVARCGGFDEELDFAKVLSIGEQQRLAVARVLLTNPTYAMLDEATSALDFANEESLYQQLKATSGTIVSVAHRSSLLKHHKQVLEVVGDGTWHLRQAKDYTIIE